MISVATISDIPLSSILSRSPVANAANAGDIFHEVVWRSKEVRYGFVNGELACMWGLIPPTLLSESAYLWLLTTDLVDQHKFLFVRHSQRWIGEALQIYPIIVGDVLVDNIRARRWLAWLGATFDQSGHFVIRKHFHG